MNFKDHMKKVIKRKNSKKSKKRPVQKNSLTSRKIQLIEQFSEKIGEIIPATSQSAKGFCFKTIAKSKGLSNFWENLSNKKLMLTHFFKNVYRYKPIVFNKIIRENISKGIERRKKMGVPVLKDEMQVIIDILLDLEIDMKSELKALNLPTEKPSIIPPPPEFQNMINKIGLDPFFDDCIKKYILGDFKNSVREAFEKIEAYVKGITGLPQIGKSLMSYVFNDSSPIIKIKSPVPSNMKSRQEGFMFLTMGTTLYIRNPFSHGDEPQPSHNEAFEYLCLANSIYRVIKNRDD